MILVCASTALGGCAVYDSVQSMVEESRREQEEARFAAAASACEKYGFRTGTDAYAQCLQTEVNQIKNREAIAAAARRAAAAAEDAGKSKSLTCRKDLMGEIKCTPD
jgi:Tfp pilus assembly protein PilE